MTEYEFHLEFTYLFFPGPLKNASLLENIVPYL